MISIYSFFIASHSLFNFGSIFPIWLFINILNLFTTIIKGSKIVIYPYLYFLPLVAAVSYAFNSTQSKIGHVIAYFVIFIIVVTSFVTFFSKSNANRIEILLELRKFLSIICNTLFISTIIDFILLANNIDYSELIPADLNYPIMHGLNSRARGFWNEPTDLCLAANSFFSIYLGLSNYLISLRNKNININLNKRYFIVFQWLTILVLSRSAASVASLTISLIFIFIYYLFFINKNFIVRKNDLIFIANAAIIFAVILVLNTSFIQNLFLNTYNKLTLNSAYPSVTSRLDGWTSLISIFYANNVKEFLIGFGPGFISLSNELGETLNSLSWILSLLLDLGIIGFGAFLSILYMLFRYLKYMPSELIPYYFISITTVLIHLCTQTGFYLPALPFVISIPIIFYRLEKQHNYIN